MLGTFSGPRALLVEDMDSHANMVARAALGINWDRARNEKQARQKLFAAANQQAEPYDAVFLDYDLSGLTGGGGEKVAALLIHLGYDGAVVIHSGNPEGGPYMARLLSQHGFQPVYAPKFDPRAPQMWHGIANWLRHRHQHLGRR